MLLKNYLSTILIIFGIYFFYTHQPYYLDFFSQQYTMNVFGGELSFFIIHVFRIIILLYVILLIPFYISLGNKKGKAYLVMQYFYLLIKGQYEKINQQHKTALLAYIVKFFFAPLLVYWLFNNIFLLQAGFESVINNGLRSSFTDFNLYSQKTFFFLLNLILFIDVLFFTLGYLIEHPKLHNTIKSVEPTAIGWIVALACYPPFNGFISNIASTYNSDFPMFENSYWSIAGSIAVLILMGLYASATFSLGLKSSNLTNRGIVSSGLYKYIRHPAYISKNLAWLIGTLPFIFSSLAAGNYKLTRLAMSGYLTRAFIYYMRAKTEEAHLALDPEYRQYMQKVPYKFIPKVW